MTIKVSKLNVWLKHFLNDECSTTFLNKTESAKRAKYKCSTKDSFRNVGHQNFTKLSGKIDTWLNENGLSDNVLKIKLLHLLDAKESKFQKIKGAVTSEGLQPGITKLVESGLVEFDKDGNKEFVTGETLVQINVDALEIQRKTLDMALKVKNLYPKQKLDVNVSGDLTIELVDFCNGEE